MKFHELRLLAVGPFTDLTLRLDGGREGLHLIHGPNEAGKSSALRAVFSLLFGFPERTGDDFRHAYKRLRVGGTLAGPDGQVLEVTRRKARSNSLWDGGDAAVVSETALSSLLGGMDEDRFRAMFGIDHGRLVQGGRDILEGGGHLGQMLFAAGAGIGHLHEIAAGLQKEAGELFTARAQKPRINAALRRYADLRGEAADASLPPAAWEDRQTDLARFLGERAELAARLEEARRGLDRLTRIRDAHIPAARRTVLKTDLDALAGVPLLAPDFGQRRRELTEKRLLSGERLADVARRIAGLEESRQALGLDDPVLAVAGEVEELVREAAAVRKAMNDAAKLESRRTGALREAERLLTDIRPAGGPDADEIPAIDKPRRLALDRLGRRHGELLARRKAAGDDRDRVDRETARLRERLSRMGEPAELSGAAGMAGVARSLAALRRMGDAPRRLAGEETAIALASDRLAADAARLSFFPGGDLLAAPMPPEETLTAFEERFSSARKERDRLTSRLSDAADTVREAETALSAFEMAGAVPTEADLEAVRDRRDGAWGRVRSFLPLGTPPLDGPPASAADGTAVRQAADALDTGIIDADHLADRLRREADRVAHRSSLASALDRHRERWQEAQTRLAAAEDRHAALEKEWRDFWTPAGITPATPAEMRRWLSEAASLRERRLELDRRRREASSLAEELSRAGSDLARALADALPQAPESPGIPADPEALAVRAEEILSRNERAEAERSQIRKRLETLEAEAACVHDDMAAVETELEKWRSAWETAMTGLGLPVDTSPETAHALVEDLRAVAERRAEAAEAGERKAVLEGEIARFEERCGVVSERFGGAGLDDLRTRLEAAREARTRRESLEQERRAVEKDMAALRETLARAEAGLEALRREAGAGDIDGLPAIEEASRRRRELESALSDVEEQLTRLARGASLAEFLEEAAAVSPEGLVLDLERLSVDIAELETRRAGLDEAIGRVRADLERMDGSDRAADLAQRARSVLASVAADAGRYTRLSLAAGILEAAVERYRERHQGPVLARSAELFRSMTLGTFEGLRLSTGQNGAVVVVGIRPDGEAVPVSGMSEGTADQLYLAIRVASLEHYLESAPALPFISDDILIQFDDRRAGAALDVLAGLSRKTQVIFFTHHGHLVDLARSRLSEDVLFVHRLDHRGGA